MTWIISWTGFEPQPSTTAVTRGVRTGPETQVMVGIFQCTGQVCARSPRCTDQPRHEVEGVSVCCSVPQNQVQQQAAC